MGQNTYFILKTAHIAGVILLVGNVTVTAIWKTFAMRTKEAPIVAFSQRLVTINEFLLTVPGIILIAVTGLLLARVENLNIMKEPWLVAAEVLFAISGSIWLLILIPIQIRQERESRAWRSGEHASASFYRDNAAWLSWGILATIPLVGAIWVMVAKP